MYGEFALSHVVTILSVENIILRVEVYTVNRVTVALGKSAKGGYWLYWELKKLLLCSLWKILLPDL